jgi:2'-5' RNA ligase
VSGNLFFAVDLSADERQGLAAALTEASPGPRVPGRRVHPDNWHITLRFLGPIDDATCERVVHELEETLDARRGRVRCSGLGAFPRTSRASVMFAAVDDGDDLVGSLAAQCETACREVGLEPEERPHVPHVTLARIRPPRDVRRLIETFGEFSIWLAIDEITLMRTVQGEGGVRYEPESSFPLR